MNDFSAVNNVSASVRLVVNNVTETSFLGTVNISEELQLGIKAVLSVLKTMRVYTVRLTGCLQAVAERAAGEFCIDEFAPDISAPTTRGYVVLSE